MSYKTDFDNGIGADGVPAAAILKLESKDRYGHVAGLEDQELADPVELERQVMRQEWGPILALPFQGMKQTFNPVRDENGGLDWGAFGTVDFERYRPEFDKARYKVEKLREELRDVLIMFDIVRERISGRSKYLVLKYLRMGIIHADHIINDDMQWLARYYLRAKRLQVEIARIKKAGWVRKVNMAKQWLASH